MAVSSSAMFSPVSLSAYQAERLEAMMKQQVNDAIRARSIQVAKHNKLNLDWRLVGVLDQLKTFKLRGADPCSSTSSWATTLEKTTRATACNLNEAVSAGETHTWNKSSRRSGCRKRPVSRRTIEKLRGRRDPLDPSPPLQSFRTFGRVQGNYRDIVDVHHSANSAVFVQKQKMLSPAVIDGAVLRTIRASKDSYFGIKWLAEHSYSSKRDVCFVEMVGYTINCSGQEIGFIATASIDVPECPELSGIIKLTRVRMKRTMLVIPSADAPKVTSEVFVMGASEANESSIVAHLQYRLNMTSLNSISLVIDSQNITKKTLTLKKNWIPDENRPSCIIYTRKFQKIYRRRHHCRMCGDVVCKTCYVTRSVSASASERNRVKNTETVSQSKFCVRCVMELRVVDTQQKKFTPFVSRLLSHDRGIIDVKTPSTEAFLELPSPNSNSRVSSFVNYYDLGINSKPVLNINQINTTSPDDKNVDNDKKRQLRTDNIGEIGAMVSIGSWSSKSLQSSLATSTTRLNSYSRLNGFPRHNSSSSLNSTIEEKMIIKRNKINRIVVI